MAGALRAALLGALALGVPACSVEGGGSERLARRGSMLGHGPWQPESSVPAEPQEAPGMVVWEVTAHPPDADPTPEQAAAARSLLERSFASARARGWVAFRQARRDGYRRLHSDPIHYANEAFILDDAILDPERPEFLMYYETGEGRALVGYMFLARRPEERGPQIGGASTIWHYHVWAKPACLLERLLTVGDPDANGVCARGELVHRTPEMIHVWLVDHPGGPFATSMRIDPELLPELLERRAAVRGF